MKYLLNDDENAANNEEESEGEDLFAGDFEKFVTRSFLPFYLI